MKIEKLRTYFFTDEGVVKAVDGVDLEIYPNETLGVIGESGCGKSVMALSIMRLIGEPQGKIVEGKILFKGEDLTKLNQGEMISIRGNYISMIFQEPMTSLDPVFSIGDQISESIISHKKVSKKEAKIQSINILKKVGIPEAEKVFYEYPHQLSGGMRQRVMIGMALSCDPQLLIADEPTTALDVTIQAQILELMDSLKAKFNMSIIIITHDLGVIAEMANRVAVIYAGKVVEYTDVISLFKNPLHPYTYGLMKAIPYVNKNVNRLYAIPGIVPDPLEFPSGCKFNPRCRFITERCKNEEPNLIEVEPGHKVRCWHYKELKKEK